jgi:hypothetical protein
MPMTSRLVIFIGVWGAFWQVALAAWVGGALEGGLTAGSPEYSREKRPVVVLIGRRFVHLNLRALA